ncbi:MAG TPA: hypothetical protein ENN17_04460 [bacterium]|nr:hypothetical protein [bacterium]
MFDDIQHTVILIIGGAGGALGTFLLQKYGLAAVIASCLVGLTGALIEHLVKLPHLAPVVFTGSFVGMTGLAIGTWPLIATARCFAGFLYAVSLYVFSRVSADAWEPSRSSARSCPSASCF